MGKIKLGVLQSFCMRSSDWCLHREGGLTQTLREQPRWRYRWGAAPRSLGDPRVEGPLGRGRREGEAANRAPQKHYRHLDFGHLPSRTGKN